MIFFQDWAANTGNTKGRVVMLLFRIAQWVSARNMILRAALSPYLVFYRAVINWGLGIELPVSGHVGPRLKIYHGQGLVVYNRVHIGADVTLRHCTTIGSKLVHGVQQYPILEDGVDIGANSVVIGGVTIGANAIIGAGSVVTKSIPPNGVFAGNPARPLR